MATYSVYNGAVRSLLNGNVAPGALSVRLYSSFAFNPADTSIVAIDGNLGSVQLPTAAGYTAGGAALTGVTYTISETNGCIIAADNAIWAATGADITASHALVFSGTVPLTYIDFEGAKTAPTGTSFIIAWPTQGVIKFGPVVSI